MTTHDGMPKLSIEEQQIVRQMLHDVWSKELVLDWSGETEWADLPITLRRWVGHVDAHADAHCRGDEHHFMGEGE